MTPRVPREASDPPRGHVRGLPRGTASRGEALSPRPHRPRPRSRVAVVGAFSQAPSEARAELESLRVAAVHHWRARMMVKLSHLYAEQVWDRMPLPRKFFIKHRGFGPSHGRDDLPSFRRLFLRCALASADRACELAPFSVECATLRACVLSLLTTVGGAERATDSQLARACAACRTAVRLGDARGAATGHLETVVLHAPAAAAAGVGRGGPRDIRGMSPGTTRTWWMKSIQARSFSANSGVRRARVGRAARGWITRRREGNRSGATAATRRQDRVRAATKHRRWTACVTRRVEPLRLTGERDGEDEGEAEDEVAAAGGTCESRASWTTARFYERAR